MVDSIEKNAALGAVDDVVIDHGTVPNESQHDPFAPQVEAIGWRQRAARPFGDDVVFDLSSSSIQKKNPELIDSRAGPQPRNVIAFDFHVYSGIADLDAVPLEIVNAVVLDLNVERAGLAGIDHHSKSVSKERRTALRIGQLRTKDGAILEPAGGVVEVNGRQTNVAARHRVVAGVDGEVINCDVLNVHHGDDRLEWWTLEILQVRLDQDPFDLVAAREIALDIHFGQHTPQNKRLRDDELFWVEGWTYLDHVAGSGCIYCGSDRGVLSIRTRGVGMSNRKSCSGARRTEHPQEQQR